MVNIKSTLYRLDVTILGQIEHTFCDQGNSQHYVVNHLWIKRPSIPRSSSIDKDKQCFLLQPDATDLSTNKESKH